MPTAAQIFHRLPLAILLAGAGVWGMMTIWLASPLPEQPRSLIAASYLVTLLAASASTLLSRGRRFLLPLAYFCILSVFAWSSNIEPSHVRQWGPPDELAWLLPT